MRHSDWGSLIIILEFIKLFYHVGLKRKEGLENKCIKISGFTDETRSCATAVLTVFFLLVFIAAHGDTVFEG